jgi:hypothetical protein
VGIFVDGCKVKRSSTLTFVWSEARTANHQDPSGERSKGEVVEPFPAVAVEPNGWVVQELLAGSDHMRAHAIYVLGISPSLDIGDGALAPRNGAAHQLGWGRVGPVGVELDERLAG